MPGAMYDYFRGNPDGRNPLEFLAAREPIRPAYREPEARLATLDEQGLVGCWLFPTLGMIYEEPLKDDPEAVCLTFRAFNRWLAEDWGFDHDDRIYRRALPHAGRRRLGRRGADLGARRGAPHDRHAPGRADHRRRRALAVRRRASTGSGAWPNEAGITVVLHASDGGRVVQRLRGRRLRGQLLGSAATSRRSSRSPSSGPSTTTWSAWSSRTTWCSSPTCASPRSRTAPSSCPTWCARCARRPTRSPGYFPEDPIEIFRRTSGSTRSGRTTSTRWSTSWAPTGSSSAPTGPTSRPCPSPSTTCARSRTCRRRTAARSSTTTPRSCSTAARPGLTLRSASLPAGGFAIWVSSVERLARGSLPPSRPPRSSQSPT